MTVPDRFLISIENREKSLKLAQRWGIKTLQYSVIA
jgi:hypothetical protein